VASSSSPHETTVASDISAEDRREFTLQTYWLAMSRHRFILFAGDYPATAARLSNGKEPFSGREVTAFLGS
jgi:hypothetical protein